MMLITKNQKFNKILKLEKKNKKMMQKILIYQIKKIINQKKYKMMENKKIKMIIILVKNLKMRKKV